MLSNAIALAILTVAGITTIFAKLPRKIRRLVIKYGLIADILALVATYYLLGGTLTALVAASLVGLFTSVLIYIAQHPDDFVFLYDLKTFLKDKIADLKQLATEYGAKYREYKAQKEMAPA